MSLIRRLRYLPRSQPFKKGVAFLKLIGVIYNRMFLYVLDDPVLSDSTVQEVDCTVITDSEAVPSSVDTADFGPKDWVCVATTDGNVVGYLWVSHRDRYELTPLDCEYEPSGALIWRVYVDPEYRRRGIASELLRAAVETSSRDLNVSEIAAFVAANNFPSRRLFESFGFKPTSQLVCAKVLLWEYEHWSEL